MVAQRLRGGDGSQQREVQQTKGAAPVANLAVLEYRRRALVLDRDCLAHQRRSRFRSTAVVRHLGRIIDKRLASRRHGLPECAGKRAWKDDAVDRGGDDDAEADLGDARRRDKEGIVRFEGGRNADDRRRVTGQDKTVGGEVSRVLRAKGANTDPQREHAEEQHALLRK